jgi:hypothetical protein
MTTGKAVAVSAWLGFALAALFLYPLAVALDSDIFYMQWQARDTAETVAAVVLLSVLFGALVFALWRRPGRRATVALGLVALFPIASFIAGLVRQLPFEDALIAAGNSRALVFSVAAVTVAAITFTLLRWPDIFGRWLRRGLLAMSFVSIVVVQTFVTAASYAAPVVERHAHGARIAPVSGCGPILALLFDELSFAYLYGDGDVRDEYPALRRLSETATNHLAVRAPADETLLALPAYLAGRSVHQVRVDDMQLMELEGDSRPTAFRPAAEAGLFATARRLGYRTEMAGYYLPYCSLLGDLVDECQSLSFYNASGVVEGFSPLNPIMTTLIMWPRQFPFGLVKNPPFARLQRGLVEELSAFARRPVGGDQPVFRFVHFSVPHLPFVFDENGYNPPLNPLRTSPDDAYRRQLRYVDRLVNEVATGLEREGAFDRATLVVLADHGFRFGGAERDKLHIPFIVKRPGQTERADVMQSEQGELLLTQVVAGSCR